MRWTSRPGARNAGFALASFVALTFQARASDDGVREVAIFEGLVQQRVRKCGLNPEDVVRIVRSEIEPKGFQVVDRKDNPIVATIRVYITATERKDGVAAWSVRLELQEPARLERNLDRLVRASTWDKQDHLVIGKATGMCRDIEEKLRADARTLADELLAEE